MADVTCPQCGAANPAGSKFCESCGISLTQRLSRPTPSSKLGSPGAARPGGAGAPAPSAPSAQIASPGGGPAQEIGARPLGPAVTLSAGRYVIDKALGKGGMGSIFLAHDTRLDDKPVVIKEMLQNFASDDERKEAEEAFIGERKTLSALRHPNIPQITDFPTESGRFFIVQDHVDGEDLQKKADAAPNKRLPERSVLQWASQVLSVLDYLEKQDPQVIHRDIKPANILVDSSGRVQVVDFGVASHRFRVGSKQGGTGALSTAMGTPGYAPKEQFTGNETPQSDIYALGATMHQLLTGRNPQGVEPLFAYPAIRNLNPAISEVTEQIVTRALQNDPAKRWQHAADMKAAIDAVLQPRTFLSSTRSKVIAVAVVLAALLAVGVSAVQFGAKTSKQPARTIVVTPVGIIHTGSAASGVTLQGSGSTYAQPFLAAALQGYSQSHPVSVVYNPNGSGQGITQFTNNETDFGVSDVPMNAGELSAANAHGSGVMQLPLLLGGVAVIYNLNLPAGTILRMDGPTLANIFLGTITSWNDPAIAALNPGISLPKMAITTVHRSDSSGTTYIFTNYLSTVSTAFSLNVGADKLPLWPKGGIAAKGSLGVANQVLAKDGNIGYVELKFALDQKLSYMAIENTAHQFVQPSTASILAAANRFPHVDATNFSIVNAPGASSYPISGYSWGLVRAQHAQKLKGQTLIDMFSWLTTVGQNQFAARLNYVPLPEWMQIESRNTLANVHVG